MAPDKGKTKYPLSAPMSAGIDNLRRLGLNTEASIEELEEELEYIDRL